MTKVQNGANQITPYYAFKYNIHIRVDIVYPYNVDVCQSLSLLLLKTVLDKFRKHHVPVTELSFFLQCSDLQNVANKIKYLAIALLGCLPPKLFV